MDQFISGEWLRTLYALGAVQGLFLVTILASRRHNSVPNKLLAGVMLVFSIDLAAAYYHISGLSHSWPAFIGLDYPTGLLYGPLFYLYARTLTEPGHPFRRRYVLHFIPFLALVLLLVPFYFKSGAEKLVAITTPEMEPYTRMLIVVVYLKLAHALTYLMLTVRQIGRYRRRIKDTFSNVERVNLAWLRNIMIGTVFLAVLGTLIFIISRLQPEHPVVGIDPDDVYDNITLLGVTIFVYAIGYMGLRQPEVFQGHTRPIVFDDAPVPVRMTIAGDGSFVTGTDPYVPENAAISDKPKYAKSGMDPETAREHVAALLRLMDTEKPYRFSDLTLQDLADRLSISTHNLTEVINTQIGQNFYDFVNSYRIREVQERLKDPGSTNLTLLAIGLDAGFQSKSSFNAVFKKHTNMTPSEYRRAHGIPITE